MSQNAGQELLDSACFNLGFLGAQMTQAFSVSIEAIGLTHKQVGLLAAVSAGLAHSQREIASSLRVAPSLVVSLVDQLVDIGAVVRQRSETDRRIQTVELTALGEELLVSSLSVAEHLDRQTYAALTDKGKAALDLVLAELAVVHEGGVDVDKQRS